MGRALITGASGFVGRHLMTALLADGWNVDAIVRPASVLNVPEGYESQVRVFRHDPGCPEWNYFFQDNTPSIVFHLWAKTTASDSHKDIEDLVDSNICFGTHLLQAAADHGVRRIVNAGSFYQHYDNLPSNPINLYAALKDSFVKVLDHFVCRYGMSATTLEFCDTYGPADTRQKALNLIIRALRSGVSLELSPGHQYLDLVHVTDAISALRLAAHRLEGDTDSGLKTYKLTSAKSISLRDLVALVERIAKTRLAIEWGSVPYRHREMLKPWNTPTATLPGWTPAVSLEEGLAALVREMK